MPQQMPQQIGNSALGDPAPSLPKTATPSTTTAPAAPAASNDPVASFLNTTSLPNSSKHQLWAMYHSSKDLNSFTTALKKVNIPNSVKHNLWNLKQNSLSQAQTPTQTQVQKAPQTQTQSQTQNTGKNILNNVIAASGAIAKIDTPHISLKDMFNGFIQSFNLESAFKSMWHNATAGPDPSGRRALALQYAEAGKKIPDSLNYGPSDKQLVGAFVDDFYKHTGKYIGQAAAMAVTGGLTSGEVGDSIESQLVKVADKGALSADQRAFLQDKFPGLYEKLFAGEKAGPGTIKTLTQFSASLPATQKVVYGALAARQTIIRAGLSAMVDKFVNGVHDGQDFAVSVQRAAEAANDARLQSEEGADLSLASKISILSPHLDAKDLGETLMANVQAPENQINAIKAQLYKPLFDELQETGAQVDTTETAKAAIDWWRKKVAPLAPGSRGVMSAAIKNELESVIPFDALDKAALTKFKSSDFFDLTKPQQDEILKEFKFPTMNPSRALATTDGWVQAMNKTDSGLPRAVYADLNNKLKESMNEAFTKASPEIAAKWNNARSITYAQVQRAKTSFVQGLLEKDDPMTGEALIKRVINSPTRAEQLMGSIDKVVTDNGDVIRSGDKYSNLMRKYTMDYVSKIGKDNPDRAVAELENDQRGYKQILGKDYQTVLSHYKTRTAMYANTADGAYIKTLKNITGMAEPSQIITKLIDPDNQQFSDHVLKMIQHDPIAKAQVGQAMLMKVFDRATDSGSFGSPQSMLDPVELSTQLTRSRAQLSKFLTPQQMQSLDLLRTSFGAMTVRDLRSTIGMYRTMTEGAYVLMSPTSTLSGGFEAKALVGLTWAPKKFLLASLDPTWSKWLVEGIPLMKGTKQYAGWLARGVVLSNIINQKLKQSNQGGS